MPVKNAIAILILAVISAASSSCGDSPDSEPVTISSPPITSWPATRTTDGGSFTLSLQPTEGAIRRNEHFSLELSLETRAEVSDEIAVTVDADMPAHRHGMNTHPETTALGDQRYRIDGMLFHMAGDWEITVEVSADGRHERASFPVLVE